MSREAFEAWATSCNHSIDKDDRPGSLGHTYAYTYTEYAWRGWSALDAEVAELKAKIGELEAERVVNSVIASDRDARIAELEEELNAIYEADAGVGI